MRPLALLVLPPLTLAALLVAAPAARAQHWNEFGPGRDLLSSVTSEFDNFRQRTPNLPAFTPPAAASAAQTRAPIPILDWMPPPPPPPRRVSTTAARRTEPAPRRAEPVMRDIAPLPSAAAVAPAPVAAANGNSDWERSFGERERELERLRRILEEDRLRYQQSRQPQLR